MNDLCKHMKDRQNQIDWDERHCPPPLEAHHIYFSLFCDIISQQDPTMRISYTWQHLHRRCSNLPHNTLKSNLIPHYYITKTLTSSHKTQASFSSPNISISILKHCLRFLNFIIYGGRERQVQHDPF